MEKTLRLTPAFVSQHGLSNLRPPSCQVIVYPDRPPGVTIISPEREISLRPSDQVTIEFAARDDFGIVRAELVAFVGDQPDMENAVVVPPQSERGQIRKTPADARGTTNETKQAKIKDGKAANRFAAKADRRKSRQRGQQSRVPPLHSQKSAAEPDGKPQPRTVPKARRRQS